MQHPIDEIKRAEPALQELLKAAMEIRRQAEVACPQNPQETAELRLAAAALEDEVRKIEDYLQQWRQNIQ